MKKTAVAIVAFMILIQGVYAISSDLLNSYKPGQTVLMKISGNVLEPLGMDNVEFRRGHVLVPFDYEIKQLGDSYYVWFITPMTENNYTITIKDIATTVSGATTKTDYVKEFSVTGNISDYSVKPGFVYTKTDFEISVLLNEDNDKTVSTDFPSRREVVLKPGQNKISYSIINVFNTQLLNISIGKYTVLAYVISNKTAVTVVNDSVIKKLLEEHNLTDVTHVKDNETLQEVQNLCYELNGKPCSAGQTCKNGESRLIAGEVCCIGLRAVCLLPTKETSYAWIGYLIAGVVLIVGVFIAIRYLKAKKDKNPLQRRVEEIEKKTR